MEHIDLRHISPWRTVRIAAVGNPAVRLTHEELGMLRCPRMIPRYMVRDEVENQSHPTPRQFFPRDSQSIGAPEILVHNITVDAVRRSDNIVERKIRQRLPIFGQQ